MQTAELGGPIDEIERNRCDQQSARHVPRNAQQRSCRCTEINSQAARADSDRNAEQRERTLRLLMADQREAAL